MKSLRAIAVIFAVIVVASVISATLSSRQAQSPVVATGPTLGPAETVCVYPYPRIKPVCQTLQIGMKSADIEAVFGKPLPVERSTSASGHVEHWRYFSDRHDPYKYVYLTFFDDHLDAIRQ